jgi:hypothetical protein
MWPTSMPRRMRSVPVPEGLGSPATTLRTSTTSRLGQVAAPVHAGEVHPRSFAPQTKSASARAAWSTYDAAFQADGPEVAGLGAGGAAIASGDAMRSGLARPAASAP